MANITLYSLITFAYGIDCLSVNAHELISRGPGWITSDLYTVQAVIPEGSLRYTFGQLSKGEAPALQQMLQNMLTDRFKLAVHRESKELPVYLLSIATGGPKLQPTQEGSCIRRDPNNPAFQPPPRGSIGCGTGGVTMRDANGFINAAEFTLDEFSTRLDLVLDRPVVNKAGITGLFNHLDFAREGTTLPPASTEERSIVPEALSIFTAVQQQLGLRSASTAPKECI